MASAPAAALAPKARPAEAPVASSEPEPEDEILRERDWHTNGQKMAFIGPDVPIYDDAYAAERVGNLAEARKKYFQLIQQWPTSPLVPYAYFAFGEMFFADAKKGDPSKYSLAEQAYKEVTKFPTRVASAAWRRMAEIYDAQGDAKKAAAARAKAK